MNRKGISQATSNLHPVRAGRCIFDNQPSRFARLVCSLFRNDHMNKILSSLAVLLALATPTLAYDLEKVGTIAADFGGEAIEHPTARVTRGDEVYITAFLHLIGALSSLSLTGLGDDNARLDINATFLTDAPNVETPPFSMEVSYAPTGTAQHWISDDADGTNSVTFTTLSFEGDKGHVTGTFSATLCYAEGYGEEADMNNCRPIEGNFDTPIEIER